MRRIVSIGSIVLLVAALSVLGTGCSGGIPKDTPGITGTVTDMKLDMKNQTVTVLVDGSAQKGGVGKASVTVNDKTKVFGPDGEEARAVDMNKGTQVSVWFEGPVAESFPVQGTAAVLQILK